jgi:hypothetical protein
MDKVDVNKLITDFPKKKVDADWLEKLKDSFAGKSSFCNSFIKYFEKLQDIKERVVQDSMLADDHEKTNWSYCAPFF